MKIFELMNESLMTVDEDVNRIYDNFYRADLEELQKTGKISSSMFREHKIDSGYLTSPMAVSAHQKNPVEITINSHQSGNSYTPQLNRISITINWNAISFAENNYGGYVSKAYEGIDDSKKAMFKSEFTEEKMKGSIHHELVHWIDDTLHGKHITTRIQKAVEKNRGIAKKNIPIDVDKMEIQAQIHNIYQLHKKYPEVWDELTFSEMIAFSPSLTTISKKLSNSDLSQWKKLLRKRMHREGLLGKSM